MKRDDPRHGTYAGAQQHRKEGKRPCKPCRLAYNAYQKEHRTDNQRTRAQSRARSRALWRLAEWHPEEFQRLYAAELSREASR